MGPVAQVSGDVEPHLRLLMEAPDVLEKATGAPRVHFQSQDLTEKDPQ